MAEPSLAHTIEILKGLRDRYEAHHRVSITDAALVGAATMADRYINDRFLPDKAIDLIDEAGARLRIRRMTAPPDLREFDERIAATRREKESAIDAQDFEKAAALRDTEKRLLGEKGEREKQWKAGDMDVVAEVDEEPHRRGARHGDRHPRLQGDRGGVLAAAAHGGRACTSGSSAWTTRSTRSRRPSAAPAPASRTRAVRAARSSSPAPRASGRPRLAKTLAEFLFGDEDSLIQARHERVQREAHRLAAVRLASRLRGVRGGRPPPRRCAASRSPWCSSTRSRRPTPTSSTRCCRSWRTVA
ncbi:hypothetical protein GCM10025868_30000 [Angustibacter aerolatus]|uniref:UVR domain-containing protein n=1 Tax=Angustibacter aerolatus TaxID=1162965 RepID=A0ABQ6JHP1_9ACTN|nr:hypothetical protein GCM10025868_30000 [Angustibacter aerolatus]